MVNDMNAVRVWIVFELPEQTPVYRDLFYEREDADDFIAGASGDRVFFVIEGWHT